MRKPLQLFNRLPREHYLRRMCLWAVVLVAMAMLFWVAWYEMEEEEEGIATVVRLVEHFDGLAFGSGRRDLASKWIVPIRVGLHGDGIEEWRKSVEVIASEFEGLTGLDIEVVDPSSAGENLHLHFVSHENLYSLAAHYDDITNRDTLRQITSEFHALAIIVPMTAIEVTEAAILLTPDHVDGAIVGSMRHEFFHSLGILFHSDAVYPTLMGTAFEMSDLSANDRIALRALYDDRITAGMPRDEALKIARDIITELVAEAKAKEAAPGD